MIACIEKREIVRIYFLDIWVSPSLEELEGYPETQLSCIFIYLRKKRNFYLNN